MGSVVYDTTDWGKVHMYVYTLTALLHPLPLPRPQRFQAETAER